MMLPQNMQSANNFDNENYPMHPGLVNYNR